MDADVALIGAGVVGLAAGAALARAGRSVLVVERHAGIAREITSRNSEVVHAGIYYPPDSLKARLCVAGRRLLYAHCERRRVPYRRVGKLIVATRSEQIETLESLFARGRANGVEGLEMISGETVTELEPRVRALAALWSPQTGIVDGHALCLSYAAEMESFGGSLVLDTSVEAIEPIAGGYRIETRNPDGIRSRTTCAALVNAAGLDAPRMADAVGLDTDACGYRIYPCKGDYFALAAGAGPGVSRLVYPVPQTAGLGVHVTLDLSGRLRLGPDSEYVDRIHYEIDPAKAASYAASAGEFLPGLRAQWLTPDYAGIRPKLAAPGEAFADFAIREESDRGYPGFVNAIGIESPGLTAAGAIAEHIVELLAGL